MPIYLPFNPLPLERLSTMLGGSHKDILSLYVDVRHKGRREHTVGIQKDGIVLFKKLLVHAKKEKGASLKALKVEALETKAYARALDAAAAEAFEAASREFARRPK
jgi:hypothetical protein